MTSAAKVSIITVSFNAEKFIERTIQSVINQTYPHIEYLIIDGNSKDGTVGIIKKYADHIDYWISEPDKNLYDAMNKGIKKATGDYLWFLNSGDSIYGNNTLEKILEYSREADFIYGETVIADRQGNKRGWHKKTPLQNEISARSLINGMVICHQSMLVKKSIAAPFNLKWKIAADLDWTIRALKKAKTFYHFHEPVCLYLEEGLSDNFRRTAITERYHILVEHFGLASTLAEHIKMFMQFLRRGRVD